MQNAASAYAKVSQATQSPRELEAHVLLKAASRLQGIQDNWDERKGDLDAALTYNRKLWTVLVTSATEASNPLSREIKQGITQLAIFIFNQILDMTTDPEPRKLGVLININREIAAGLRTVPPAS